MWIGNAQLRRAYKVVRYIKTRDSFRCINRYGRQFTLTAEQVREAGYVVLKRKPRYAAITAPARIAA